MVYSMSVADMLTSAVTSLKALDSAYNSFADSLTKLDILCVVITNTSDAFYDYYDLSTFRAASPCSGVASSVVQLAEEKASNLSCEYVGLYGFRTWYYPLYHAAGM